MGSLEIALLISADGNGPEQDFFADIPKNRSCPVLLESIVIQ
jgi:hypothetical protein